MSDVFLLDTDVLIDVGRGVDEAVQTLEQVEAHGTPAVSAVTHMELLVGCRNKTELRRLDKFLRRFQIFPIDEQTSDQAVGLIRRYRLSHGMLIADALIAATALVNGVPLISKNQRDYRYVEDLNLLAYPNTFPD